MQNATNVLDTATAVTRARCLWIGRPQWCRITS